MAPLCCDQQFRPCGREQQWALLRNSPPFHHAALRHPLHCGLQVEDEQIPGLYHVWALLCVPDRQRPSRRQDHRVPCVYLTRKEVPLS